MGAQRFMFGLDNQLTSALLTPSSVRASYGLFPVAGERVGNGSFSLQGAYTGSAGATLDVEVVDSIVGANPSISAPEYRGVGNGTLNVSGVDSAAVAQTITIACASVGVVTTAAAIDFYGVTLQARTAGASGNDITISIDDSAIVATQSYALLDAIEDDSDTLRGVQYAFGGKSLVNGNLRSDAPRLRFGTDQTTVYRQWSEYVDGELLYRLAPKVASAIGAGTPVYTLSGTYSATVSDGVTTETFTGLITLFDLLNTLRSRSALVQVLGVVSEDYTPNGMASTELMLKTSPHLGATTVSGSKWLSHLDDAAIVGTVTETEVFEIECTNNDVVGGEVWAVRGSASGGLASVTTGALATRGAVQFRVPRKLPTDAVSIGRIFVNDRKFVSRDEEEGVPDLCLYRPILGSSASNKTLTWTWTARPPEECSCEDSTVVGKPDPDCLGLTSIEGDTVAWSTAYKTRMQSLYDWRADTLRTNSEVGTDGMLRTARIDADLIDQVTAIFADALAQASDVPAAMTEYDAQFTQMQSDLSALANLGTSGAVEVWQPGIGYSFLDIVVPPVANGFKYMCYQSHASHGVNEWGTLIGGTSRDIISTTELPEWINIGAVDADDLVSESGNGAYSRAVSDFVRRYQAAMDKVLVEADILPKSKASTQRSRCWQDPGDAFYWKSEDGYMPAFSNRYYHSVVPFWDDTAKKWTVKDTYEFGFAIRVGCPERLKEGDQIIIEIETATRNITYAVGDVIRLPVLLGGPLELLDGTDGTDQVTWSVRSSISGAWPDYVMPLTSPPVYTGEDVEFTITGGSIPFVAGDVFTFALEGGHIRYRFNAGAWSSTVEIAAPITLPNGLTLVPYSGASPSWKAGDAFSWRIEQPYSPETLKHPVIGQQWQWSGTSATLDIDLGEERALDSAVVALHTLPSTATLTLQGGVATPTEWTEPLTVRQLVTAKLFSVQRTARFLRLTVSGASGAGIGWLWVGMNWKTAMSATRCVMPVNYAITVGRGANAGAVFNGASGGVSLSWGVGEPQGGYLTHVELNQLIERLDYSARNANEVICIVPNYASEQEARLVRLAETSIVVSDIGENQAVDTQNRRYSLDLEFDGVAV